MAIIECLNGATTQNVGGTEYTFIKDEHDRFTAKVLNIVDIRMFLSRQSIYREVPETPLPKKSRKAVQPGKQSEPEGAGNDGSGEGGQGGSNDTNPTGGENAGGEGSEADASNEGGE